MSGKNKGGRPLKKIDKTEFEKLCGLQCTRDEICGFFDVSDKTLDNWCKRNYTDENGQPMGFSAVFAIKRQAGKISLRRSQFLLAAKNANMAIFLGKNWLGQSDKISTDVTFGESEDDPITKALAGLGAELEQRREENSVESVENNEKN